MYGWYSNTQQKNICERLEMQAAARHFPKRTYPYIYYIDMQDKIVLVTEVNKGNNIIFEDAIPLGELKKFYKASETPLKLD
tara:strand:- start:1425 stop:1667 length:243 start_codon:yes stop_codon:yes gene_type:complete